MSTNETIKMILNAIHFFVLLLREDEKLNEFTQEMGNGLALTNTEIF